MSLKKEKDTKEERVHTRVRVGTAQQPTAGRTTKQTLYAVSAARPLTKVPNNNLLSILPRRFLQQTVGRCVVWVQVKVAVMFAEKESDFSCEIKNNL